MSNQHVLQRLTGIQAILNGVHQGGASMSSASRGREREAFVDDFLSQMLPPTYRFGSGDATDINGARSGQLDVVVELPFSPSLPLGRTTRLYLAEGVGAVVEVKSDVAAQWNEAVSTAAQLATVKRSLGISMSMGALPSVDLPLFVAGYKGWKNPATVAQHLAANPTITGILVVDPGIFLSSPAAGSFQASGPWALWGLISCLYQSISAVQAAVNRPFDYAL